jgi:glycerate 2-kinase
MNDARQKATLIDLFRAAIAAVEPGAALARALAAEPATDGVWIIALGKAARPMADAAVACLSARGHAPAGGLVVAPAAGPGPHPSIEAVAGNHPEPGAESFAAAEALDRLVRRVPAGAPVWVLLSGGTSSLVAAPEAGIAPADLTALFRLLLRSGLDIARMNLVRKRFTRWSGGRLARSLAHARVRCYAISDVVGDDLAAIGSGPSVPDPSTARAVRDALVGARLWDAVPPSLRAHLDDVQRGRAAETPKPGDDVFAHADTRVIASNRVALDAAAGRARALGLSVRVDPEPLVGEAATAGVRIAERLRAAAGGHAPRCLILGGETTVTMAPTSSGIGGRSQELALAAARILDGGSPALALLAAGTDGRDGPTDAAGAVVDAGTWRAIAAAGRDPARDLQRHDAYPALAAANALLKTGPTGTNVMDIVIALG